MQASTTERLMTTLWEAAEVLRASVSPSQYPSYISRILTLKFLSDGAEEGRIPFSVPPSARWAFLQRKTQALGSSLNHACEALEDSNPTLRNVLTSLDFDSVSLGEPGQRDHVLGMLVARFSTLPFLGREHVSSGLLSDLSSSLLFRAAEFDPMLSGEHSTPPSVARLLVGLLDPQAGMRVCDQSCGTGGALVACARYVAHTVDPSARPVPIELHGQEKNFETWALCRMNLLLHGLFDARIELGDVLREPRLVEGGHLLKYDRVIADPPLNLEEWGADHAREDPFRRFDPIPPRNNANYAFIQHSMAVLNEGGLAAVLSTQGVLFRGGNEQIVRRALLEEDHVEAVIGLPGNLLYGTGIAPIVLVLRRGAAVQRQNKVLFVDASQGGSIKGRQRHLRQQDIDEIVASFHSFEGRDGFARAVEFDEIRSNDWNLNVARYVRRKSIREWVDPDEQVEAISAAEHKRDEAARRMDVMMKLVRRTYLLKR
jgi:type I restriction enzyme M protein